MDEHGADRLAEAAPPLPAAASPGRGPRLSGRLRRRLVAGLLVALSLGGLAFGAVVMSGWLPHPVVAGDPQASGH